MAITAVKDMRGRSGRPYLGSDTEIQVPYIVYTDSRAQGETDILNSGVLPLRGQVFPENAYLAAYSLSLKREDQNPIIWRAVVTYKTDSLDEKESEKQFYPDPTTRPAEIEWDAVGYEVPAVFTVEDFTPPGETENVPPGTLIRNSAWDPFDPPPMKTDFHWVANVTKFVPVVPYYTLAIPGTVNSDQYVLDNVPIAIGASRITGLRIGRRQRENGVNYRQLQLTIEFRPQRDKRFASEEVPTPWILELVDEGYNYRAVVGNSYLNAGSGEPARATDDEDRPSAGPVLLNGAGGPLTGATFETAVYRHYKIYRTSLFSQLPLS